jgi:hypothetical protein
MVLGCERAGYEVRKGAVLGRAGVRKAGRGRVWRVRKIAAAGVVSVPERDDLEESTCRPLTTMP